MLKRFLKKEHGQGLVEFALIIPILLVLIFGVVEFGRIYGASLMVNQGARSGARIGSLGVPDTEIQAAVKNAVPVLDPAKLTITIVPLDTARVRGEDITVTVKYPVTVVAPFISAITGEIVNVNGVCVMRVE